MADIGVDLKRAWPSIAQVIQRRREPGGHDAQDRDQGEGSQHTHAKEEQRVEARTRPCRLLFCRHVDVSNTWIFIGSHPHTVVRSGTHRVGAGTLASGLGSGLAPVVAAVSTSMSPLSMA